MASPDNEISKREIITTSRLFPADPGHDFRRYFRYRMDRYRGFQFIEKRSPPVADLRRGCSIDAVADLGDGQGAENDRDFANRLPHHLGGLFRSEFPPLGGDQNAGVEG